MGTLNSNEDKLGITITDNYESVKLKALNDKFLDQQITESSHLLGCLQVQNLQMDKNTLLGLSLVKMTKVV